MGASASKWWAMACLVALVGCGDDDGVSDASVPEVDGAVADGAVDAFVPDGAPPPTDAGPTSLSAEAFCARAQPTHCEWLTTCRNFATCADWPGTPRFGADWCERARANVEAGRLRYDAELAARCLAQMEASLTLCWSPPIFACTPFLPNVPVGETCFPLSPPAGTMCVDGYCPDDGTCPSTCVAAVGLGEACSAGPECGSAAWCDSGFCRARGAEGEPCGACLSGLQCLTTPSGAQVCSSSGRFPGESCDETNPCLTPGYCVEGTCRTSSPRGGACPPNLNACPEGQLCVGASTGVLGTCTDLPGVGEACLSDRCESDAFCGETGRCEAYGGVGDECGGLLPACESSLACVVSGPGNGRCTPRGGPTDPCTSTYECLPDLVCVTESCRAPGSVGDTCNVGEARTCATGLHCDATTARCSAPRAEGATCGGPDRGVACVTSAYCDVPEGLDEGTCRARKPARALCTSSLECVEGLSCRVEADDSIRCGTVAAPCTGP